MITLKTKFTPRACRAFSYLELILVIVLLLIVAAIVAPQRLIQMSGRGKVSRVKSDHRSLATGIEAYYVDCNEYPSMATGEQGINAEFNPKSGAYHVCTFRLRNYGEKGATQTLLKTLSTPIAYITGYFPDPFADSYGSSFAYRQYPFTWLLFSYGPDRDENTTVSDHNNTIIELQMKSGVDLNFEPSFNIDIAQPSNAYMAAIGVKGTALHYDPTNGTTSEGDIVRNKN